MMAIRPACPIDDSASTGWTFAGARMRRRPTDLNSA